VYKEDSVKCDFSQLFRCDIVITVFRVGCIDVRGYVNSLVCCQTDVTAMTKAMKTTGVSRQLFPLGRMNKQKLLDARQLLAQLQYVWLILSRSFHCCFYSHF